MFLGWRPEVESWPPFLSSTLLLTLSYTGMAFGYLEGYLIQPFIDWETEVWRVELTCQPVSWVPDDLLECSPVFSPE